MKILLTGAGGQLGRAVEGIFGRKHQVVGLPRERLDVTLGHEVDFACRRTRPDWVVHAAAFTDVDGAERHREAALQVNAEGTHHVAEAASSIGAPMLYFSTDYVFAGDSDQPYQEDCPTDPINHYGLTKLKGEKWVERLCTRHLIVRTSWLFGEGGRNFVTTISDLARDRAELRVVNDQRGTPTYTRDLAEACLQLVERGAVGKYHVTNSENGTWFDVARETVDLLGLECRILPSSSEEQNRPARRPPYSVLDNAALRSNGFPEMRSWQSALKEFLRRSNG